MRSIKYLYFILLILSSCNKENLIVESNSEYLSFKKNILYYKSMEYSGRFILRYSDGGIKEERVYKNGLRHGEQLKWYANAEKHSIRYYRIGKKTGTHVGWWKNGKKKFEFEFNKIGEHDGIAYEWFENGSPFKFFHYKNGKEQGSQKMYKPNGNIRANYVVIDNDRFGLIGLKKCDAVLAM